MTSSDAELRARASAIERALASSEPHLDPAVLAQAREDLSAVRRRLALGVGHTVVALVGGTGSGKSSLFNAISGLSFADVGALRPTTQQAAACVWGEAATGLLDFLDIDPARRIQRESELDGTDEGDLNGLVLLDMPDHDSVQESHHRQVDRLLPLVDVLLWVVDPQKYADHALHSKYLAALSDRADAMIVLINQVDTVPTGAAEVIESSMRELLDAGGLPEVPVILTSTVTDEGVGAVRERLATVVAEPSMAARTAQAELRAIAHRLAPHLGSAPSQPPAEIGAVAARDLTRASGLAPAAASLRAGARRLTVSQPPAPQPPARGTVEAVRSRAVRQAQHGLPQRWQDSLATAMSSTARLHRALEEDLASVTPPSLRLPRPRRTRLAGGVLAIAGLILGLVVGIAALAGAQLPPALALGAVALVVVGGVLALAGHRWLGREADRLVRDYERRMRDVIDDAVSTHLLRPAGDVLARHEELRSALHP